MFYHKVYMNQIHSSSLLCQLASMWKNQVLCDAVIKAGNSHIKAHRVVLVAACPMLHSMKNASVGSNLEVRLAADIKPEAINTFLQYLYEGFMMLTEENCKDVEKIARVLQVDSILKCCADFYKCLHTGEKYEYSFHDNVEFRHVRASDLLKVHDRSKRASDLQPASPGIKRQRIQSRGGSDSFSDYGASDPWDRVPREYSGSSSARTTQPGVIEIMEDSVEIVHSDKPEDSGGTRRDNLQDRMSLSVASQLKSTNDVQIINVSSGGDASQRISNSSDSSRFSSHPTFTHSQGSSNMSYRHDPSFPNPSSTSSTRLPSSPSPHSRMPSPSSAYHPQQRNTTAHSQPKPFAAGNATQASKSYNTPSPVEQLRPGSQDQSRVTAGASTVSFSSPSSSLGAPPASSPSTSTQPPQPVALWRSTSSDAVASGPAPVPQLTEKPLLQRSESTPATTGADISIVKVESEVTFDEQFHGDDPNITFDPEDQSGDWNREDTSNEESNASEDKMPQWMAESLKDISPPQATSADTPHMPAPYRSNLGRFPSLDPVNYLFIELGQPLPEGYVRLDEEEKVCVPSVWLNRTLSQCVGKPPFFTLKKLVNGFVNPWECKYGGTSAYKNTPLEPVFNALLSFGAKNLGLNRTQGRRALNEKLYAGRKVAGIQKSMT
ncbi:zinc finger and BTB domain-containing protein 3-like isoform X3 [Saccostrea cucullata]|uniref:zinc finger and BTB domain-containing protein 3-like isoform X3 n=1 Tax=Saccostrea cuccullata TaxID=36930 RepID=UPI002ED4FEED